MTASLTEVLMALGEGEIEVDWDPELAAELVDGRGILVYWGQELIYGGIKLTDPAQSFDGMVFRFVSPEWLLGDNDIGPTLDDQVYVAGNNKLFNPAFAYTHEELGKDLNDDPIVRTGADDWKLPDLTGWVIAEGLATTTVIYPPGTFDEDVALPADILTSDQEFESRGGDQWRASVTTERTSGSIGHLRLLLVFKGHFRHPNLLALPSSWTPTLQEAGDAELDGESFVFGPIAQPQYLENTGFETADFTDWLGDTSGSRWVVNGQVSADGNLYDPHSGDWQAIAVDPTLAAGTEPYRRLINSAGIDAPKVGDRYRVKGYIRETQKGGGEAQIYLRWTRFGDGVIHRVATQRVRGSASYGTVMGALPYHEWQECIAEYEVTSEDISELTVELAADFDQVGVDGITGDPVYSGNFAYDDITIERIKGNTATFTAPAVSVVPEESYEVRALVTADAGVTGGEVGFSFLFEGPGRPDQIIDGASMDNTATAPTLLISPFVVPPGYDTVTVSLVGRDILGGSFTVGIPTLKLSDNTRAVANLSVSLTGLGERVLTTTALDGAESLHLELLAEDKADGWAVHSVSLARGETPWTSAQVANDLRTDPLTDVTLLDEGNIVGTDLITHDWHVRNMTRRAQLQHLSRSGLALPVREWRIFVDPTSGRPILDWGTPEVIFEDRTDLVFLADDFKLLATPNVERSAEGRVTRVTVVGADRQRPNGPPIPVTGKATNPNEDFLDWDGNPLNRTQTVVESSVDHPDYAASFARYKADQGAEPAENVHIAISDWRAWGPFNVGDWVYLYHPDEGLEDTANPMPYEGRTIYPKKLRVISRTWKLGDGFRVEIHRPGLANYVVDDEVVRWEEATVAELELGDPAPDFEVDQEGGAPGDQFRRFRASMPR